VENAATTRPRLAQFSFAAPNDVTACFSEQKGWFETGQGGVNVPHSTMNEGTKTFDMLKTEAFGGQRTAATTKQPHSLC
jgi:hypothetical protein